MPKKLTHAEGTTVEDIYDAFTDQQKQVVQYLIGAALENSDSLQQNDEDGEDNTITHKEGAEEMPRNVFEQNGVSNEDKHVLSHDDVKGIVADAIKGGSLKEAVEKYAVKHGIEDIEVLFPDAKTISDRPEFIARRMEWVSGVLNTTKHTPFSRIKTLHADITHEEARARGYIKGNLKKEEFFGIAKRTTGPTTVYKKQALDRDDIIDITDFDIVAWLKAEMRVMLDEELARAVLIGDGRPVDSEDKIKDPVGATDGLGIRSILHDHELYVTTVNVNIDDADSSPAEIIDVILTNRKHYKGSGTPTFYTTEDVLTKLLMLRDTIGRRLYKTVGELADELRVKEIIPVEVLETEKDLVGIIVNLTDYSLGADRGGQVATFDDFDIDYNKYKYLIETRVSGALTKIKSAMVIKKAAGTSSMVVPEEPSFNAATNTITIPSVTGVTYKIDGANQSAGNVVITKDTMVEAVPDSGYYFQNNAEDSWVYEYKGS